MNHIWITYESHIKHISNTYDSFFLGVFLGRKLALQNSPGCGDLRDRPIWDKGPRQGSQTRVPDKGPGQGSRTRKVKMRSHKNAKKTNKKRDLLNFSKPKFWTFTDSQNQRLNQWFIHTCKCFVPRWSLSGNHFGNPTSFFSFYWIKRTRWLTEANGATVFKAWLNEFQKGLKRLITSLPNWQFKAWLKLTTNYCQFQRLNGQYFPQAELFNS